MKRVLDEYVLDQDEIIQAIVNYAAEKMGRKDGERFDVHVSRLFRKAIVKART